MCWANFVHACGMHELSYIVSAGVWQARMVMQQTTLGQLHVHIS